LQYSAFGTSSDYVGFLNRGIPSSGIFTGAGAPNDPCYHQACDTTENVNYDALTINAKAAGWAAAKMALSLEGVPPRNKTAEASARRRDLGVMEQLHAHDTRMLAMTAPEHSCSHASHGLV
jgi:aminopeptidase Y